MAILAVNAGSSTLKFSLHPRHGSQALPSVLSGNIQGLEISSHVCGNEDVVAMRPSVCTMKKMAKQ